MTPAASPTSYSRVPRRAARLLGVAAIALLPFRAVCAEGQGASDRRDAAALPAGQVVASVVCAHDSSQSYALYLPSNYTPARRWPVLYAFDPGGRGRLPVELFSEAAERLGYVVVGSNNSRNGPWERATAAMLAMWRDTHARLALDPRRVYTMGMSGGAAPAALLAATSGAGVIACGSALTAEQLPETGPDHAWFIVAGRSDFNYTVNRNLAEALAGRGMPARFAEFDGGHDWPPAEVAGHALEFIQLSAIRTGRAPRDEAFVESYARAGVARAEEFAAQGMADVAADEWAALARELTGLAPVAHYDAEARRLNATEEARENRKREARVVAKFDNEVRVLLTLRHVLERGTPEILLWPTFRSAFPSGERADGRDTTFIGTQEEIEAQLAAAEIKSRLDRLVRESKSKWEATQTAARRALDGFFVETWHAALDRREAGDRDWALVFMKFCARARPERPGLAYEVARLHAARGDSKTALAELKRARALGFRDSARVARESEWDALRADPRFVEIVSAIQGT